MRTTVRPVFLAETCSFYPDLHCTRAPVLPMLKPMLADGASHGGNISPLAHILAYFEAHIVTRSLHDRGTRIS